MTGLFKVTASVFPVWLRSSAEFSVQRNVHYGLTLGPLDRFAQSICPFCAFCSLKVRLVFRNRDTDAVAVLIGKTKQRRDHPHQRVLVLVP